MSSMKDIRQRMANVRATKQVLSAMNMVSATKLHRARMRLEGILPLHLDMKKAVDDLERFAEIQNHALAAGREVKSTAYILITSDKGLCGSYNRDICEKALEHMNAGKNEKIISIGAKGCQYFKRRDKQILRRVTNTLEAQIYEGAGRLGELSGSLYASGEADEVYVAYTQFDSTLRHVPRVERLLPLFGESDGIRQRDGGMRYEPGAVPFLEHILPLYLHMCFFAALSHSIACEHAARMINMESAGKNAAEIIEDLKQMYHRKRQAAITQELSEIIGSANILQ